MSVAVPTSRTAMLRESSALTTATGTGTAIDGFSQYVDLIVTLDITVADRADGDETYDVWVTTGDGVSEWDIVHFSQVVSSGAKRFTAIVSGRTYPQNVTTASPGVAAVTTATLATVTGGANAVKSLGAGIVRHGPFGDKLNWYTTSGGTTPSLTFSIRVTAKR